MANMNRMPKAKTRRQLPFYQRIFGLIFGIVLPTLFFLQAFYHDKALSATTIDPTNGIPNLSAEPQKAITSPKEKPIQIAYAISLIKCGDFQSSTAGLLDAAAVLRHSIHQTSIRNPASGSKYDYRLYAIVHTDAEQCSGVLKDLGFTILVRDPPVKKEEIRGEYLRKHVHKEWCCGSDEFIKLYAWTIMDHPIVVHTDIDFMYFKPMDDLYDSMLLPHDSEGGRSARSRIEMEYPNKSMPENIQAYLTRDYHQTIPGRKSAFQAGFIVLRPDMEVFEEYLETIREGNYVEGFSRENGWGGKGYGGVVGAMAMQGLPAYYYDEIRPNTTVELNGCRYNHMGADVLYRNVPNFINKYKDLHGKCRRNVEGCEDCQYTDLSLVKNIHFTNCRKPWNCRGVSGGTGTGGIDPRTADYEHCMEVIHTWHEMRTDLEDKIVAVTGKKTVLDGRKGSYKKEVFMGHCDGDGANGYLPITSPEETLSQEVSDKIWN